MPIFSPSTPISSLAAMPCAVQGHLCSVWSPCPGRKEGMSPSIAEPLLSSAWLGLRRGGSRQSHPRAQHQGDGACCFLVSSRGAEKDQALRGSSQKSNPFAPSSPSTFPYPQRPVPAATAPPPKATVPWEGVRLVKATSPREHSPFLTASFSRESSNAFLFSLFPARAKAYASSALVYTWFSL